MYSIIITTNDNSVNKLQAVVSKPQYNRLQTLTKLGGFTRFNIDLYSDDEPKQRSQIIKALHWLSVYVFYSEKANMCELFNKIQ